MDAARLIQKLFPRGSGGASRPIEWIVTGLGNPGPKYKNTRHNVGWWALDSLVDRTGTELKPAGANSMTGEAEIEGSSVLLVRLLTYMNRSGDAIRTLLRKHHVEASRLIVIYDDLNLDAGRVRIRPKGGAGGHNGMKSIISSIGTEEFIRIRIGVGRHSHPGGQVDHVLGTMAPQEKKLVLDAATRAADAAVTVITEDLDTAMNRFNA